MHCDVPDGCTLVSLSPGAETAPGAALLLSFVQDRLKLLRLVVGPHHILRKIYGSLSTAVDWV